MREMSIYEFAVYSYWGDDCCCTVAEDDNFVTVCTNQKGAQYAELQIRKHPHFCAIVVCPDCQRIAIKFKKP